MHGPLGRILNSSDSMELSKQVLASFLSHLHYYSIIGKDYAYLTKFCMTIIFPYSSSVCVKGSIDSYQLNLFI